MSAGAAFSGGLTAFTPLGDAIFNAGEYHARIRTMNDQAEPKANRRISFILLVAALALAGVILVAALRSGPREGEPVVITFLGHTNVSTSARQFALFTISNQWSRPVRWSGDWVEVEGSSNFLARIVNPALPANFPGPTLDSGASFVWGVGQPDGQADHRWRLTLQYREHTLQSRLLDWSMRNPKVPRRLGPLVLVDSQAILNRTNQRPASSAWVPMKSEAQPGTEPKAQRGRTIDNSRF